MDADRLQRSIDDFLSSDPHLSPLFFQGSIKLVVELRAGSARARLAMIQVSDEARQAGLSPSPGRRMMDRLCALCSEAGLDLELLALPLPMEHRPGRPFAIVSLDKLCSFYESFGFQALPGQSSRLSRRMLRPARPARPAPPSKTRKP